MRVFLNYSSLQRHLDGGRHRRRPEKETLSDKAAITYAERLAEAWQEFPVEIHGEASSEISLHRETHPQVPMGWALKVTSSRARFTVKQKTHLTEQFMLGEKTRHKMDPLVVAETIFSERDVNGNKLFTGDEYLVPCFQNDLARRG